MTPLNVYLCHLEIMRQALNCPPWDIRVCVNPGWHRPYWRYSRDRFECEVCRRLAVWVA